MSIETAHVLKEIEREIFLACYDIISFHELQERFPNIPKYQLATILDTFEQKDIVFREDDYYLSLPLQYSPKRLQPPKRKTPK